jgi:hypothetical protein
LRDIGVPEELHDGLIDRVLSGLAGTERSLSEATLLEEIYFQVYTDPEIRKKVGYHHPLDTFR